MNEFYLPLLGAAIGGVVGAAVSIIISRRACRAELNKMHAAFLMKKIETLEQEQKKISALRSGTLFDRETDEHNITGFLCVAVRIIKDHEHHFARGRYHNLKEGYDKVMESVDRIKYDIYNHDNASHDPDYIIHAANFNSSVETAVSEELLETKKELDKIFKPQSA